MAVLAGVLAHLHLTRCRDKYGKLMAKPDDTDTETSNETKAGTSTLEVAQEYGPFVDAMPLLPQVPAKLSDLPARHPFPSHVLYWTDEEIIHLLQGTMGQTKVSKSKEKRLG